MFKSCLHVVIILPLFTGPHHFLTVLDFKVNESTAFSHSHFAQSESLNVPISPFKISKKVLLNSGAQMSNTAAYWINL